MGTSGNPEPSDDQVIASKTDLESGVYGIEEKLRERGISLPDPNKPLGKYASYQRVGDLILLSGQGSMLANGEAILGKVGADLSVSDGAKAAEMTILNILAQAREICEGDLDQVETWVRLTGFVNATPDFERHIDVLDGATSLLAALYGQAGLAARAAVGVNSLPMNIAVEIQAEFMVRP